MQNQELKKGLSAKPKGKLGKVLKWIVAILIVGLIAFRLYLPYLIKNRTIAAVNSTPGYACAIDDVSLMLYRGAICIEGFKILITTNKVDEPFLDVKLAEVSIDWNAISDGKIVVKLTVTEPKVNFRDGETKSDRQVGNADWVEPIRAMAPFDLNKFIVNGGTINFDNKTSTPPVSLHITGLSITASNLTNSKGLDSTLPSDLMVSGVMFETGTLNLEGKINVLNKVPDLDLFLKIDSVNLKSLNDFSLAYANFDFEKGGFAARSEIAMYNGKIAGYFEPFLYKVQILDWKNEEGNFVNKLWQGVLGLGFEATENQKLDRTATRVDIAGSIDSPNINIFSVIMNIFRNAFVKAYGLEIDNSIHFNDAKGGVNAEKGTVKGAVKDLFDGDGNSMFQSSENKK